MWLLLAVIIDTFWVPISLFFDAFSLAGLLNRMFSLLSFLLSLVDDCLIICTTQQ